MIWRPISRRAAGSTTSTTSAQPSTPTSRSRSASEDLTVINLTVNGILSNLGKTTNNGNGEVLSPGSVVPSDGGTYWDPDHPEDPDGTPLAPGTIVPLEVADKEAAKVEGILDNLGKTTDDVTGEVLPPGPRVGGNPATTHGVGGDTPVAPGGPIPPTNETPKAPVLGNLMKTEKLNGDVAEPGGIIPDGGWWRTPNGIIVIPPAAVAPASTLTHSFAGGKAAGMEVSDLGDEVGAVLEMPGGELFIAQPLTSGYGDERYVEVEAASGGPGTGINGGDYQVVVTAPVSPMPKVHLEFSDLDGTGVTDGTDGYGRTLPDSATTTGTTEPGTLPATAEGYDGQKGIKVAVTVRAEDVGAGGAARLTVQARYLPPGSDPSAIGYTSIYGPTATSVLANEALLVIEGVLDVDNVGVSNGGALQVRISRTGSHGDDSLAGGLNVLGVSAEVPTLSTFVATQDHA